MNFFKKITKNIRVFLLFGTLFIVLVSLALFFSKYMYESDIALYNQVKSKELQVHISMVEKQLQEQAQVLFDKTINDEAMQELMYQASLSNDAKELEVLRNKLFRMFKDDYNYMNLRDVRQLHFHLPDAVSFLRFHRPEKFADSLQGIRFGIDQVNQTHKPLSCFEEGKVFNGFRNIFPIFAHNKFVGSVEISYSFEALQKRLLASEDTSYLFLVKKSIVGKHVLSDEQSNYQQSEFLKYAYDIKTLSPNMALDLNTLYKLNKELSQRINNQMEALNVFSIRCDKKLIENKNIIATFIPIYNLHKEAVAYIVSYHNATF